MATRRPLDRRRLFCALALACGGAAAALLLACSEDSPKNPARPGSPSPAVGGLVAATDCKPAKLAVDDKYDPDVDCVVWTYDGQGALAIKHVNAGLNCCPGTIAADIQISGAEIEITAREGDDADPCDCLCLFDLDYEFTGIPAGPCTLIVHEIYLPAGAEILSVVIDLAVEPEGAFCVPRSTYPWGG